ncbi:hypothetical protein KCP74_15035 [Salmonella enterica subsp. enterica]|nr:hypothetical protein KCP74_15035 [Salmonella enterica subsp. enterica]
MVALTARPKEIWAICFSDIDPQHKTLTDSTTNQNTLAIFSSLKMWPLVRSFGLGRYLWLKIALRLSGSSKVVTVYEQKCTLIARNFETESGQYGICCLITIII